MIEACLSELTFLLIEDDGEFDNTLQVASKALPSQIYTAASAEQAVAVLETQSIDVLLADMCIAGVDLCQAVRQLYPDITILMVFAVDDIKLLLPLLSLGSIDFLPKPLDSSTLARLVSDITKRVCLQQKLTQSYSLLEVEKEFLAVALRSIGDGVMTTDLNGKVLMLNSMAERLTGWSSEQAAGRPANEVFNIVDTLSGKKLASPIEQVLATGNTLYLDKHTALLAKNGVEYHISDSVAPIFDEQHKVQGTILVFSDISETYRQRQKEKLSNDLMQDLFDNMETLAATLNADGSVIFVNKGALAILDMTLADIQGTKLWDCPWFTSDPELMRRTEEDYKQACKGSPVLHDLQAYTVMGLLWVEFSLHAVFAEDGSLQSLVAEGRSVMARKRIEDENYSALQHLKLYREQTPLAAIEWDIELRVVDWNEAAEKMFEYELAEVSGRAWVDLMLPQEDRQRAKGIWQQIIAQTGGELVEQQILTKSGRIILVEWHNAALLDGSGVVIGGVSLAIDITQAQQAQQDLLRQAKEQQDILNTMADGVVMFNSDARMLTFNRGAEKLFGYDSDDALGMDLNLLRAESDRPSVKRYMQILRDRGGNVGVEDSFEVTGRRQGGSIFPMLLSVVELPLMVDGTRRFIAVCKDITEMKSQQTKLQRAMKMDALGKLVGGIAHDYNNMLGVILGYTDLISMKFANVEGLSRYIDNISQAGERGRSLTKRMLAFSKQESSEAKAVDLNALLTEQKEFFEKSVTVQIQIEYQLSDSPWKIWIDPSELEDTLLNLTINAKHAMPDVGRLTFTSDAISLSATDASAIGLAANDYLTLSVSDTGKGIEPEVVSKIFDPFFSTKGTGGTGLGLSQVYGCMERAGGTVRVYSQLGIGTEFVLYFPRYRSNEEAASAEEHDTTLVQGHGERVLVVDDEPALRELAAEILTMAGYRVLTAVDGRDALEVMLANEFDALLSDIIMPNMDGYQLAQRVSELYPAVKIQLASGFSDNRHDSAIRQQWHEHILHKPYSSVDLLESLASVLSAEQA